MTKFIKTLLLSSALLAFCSSFAYSHCQIPCGIYDDNARVEAMLEDVATTKKAVGELKKLADKTDEKSRNQLTRWIMNKEQHAQNIISTISDYFLTQRVKPKQKDYAKRLKEHHAVIISAMKVKQNADMKHISELKANIEKLLIYYSKKL